MANRDYIRATCCDCGKSFVPPFGRGRPRIRCFECSPPSSRPAGWYAGESEEKTCANGDCGAKFSSSDGRKLYCSHKCRHSRNNRRAQVRRCDRFSRACANCGQVFRPSYGDRRRKYCARECKVKHEYALREGSTHRRRAKKFGVTYEALNKWEVFEQAGWRCQICGVPTPKSMSGKWRRNSPELDHIVPLSQGGAHTRSNVQCACRACNVAKGARPLGQFALNY